MSLHLFGISLDRVERNKNERGW